MQISLHLCSIATLTLFLLTCYLCISSHTLANNCTPGDFVLSHCADVDAAADRLSFLFFSQKFLHRKQQGTAVIHPHITKFARPQHRLLFTAEYTVEIPLCEVMGDSGCAELLPKAPSSETVRVNFCTKPNIDDDQVDYWDFVYPPLSKDSSISGEWKWDVEKRPLSAWTNVDIPGRVHDTSLQTSMIQPPLDGNNTFYKPQWKFHLNTSEVTIEANAWKVYEEEVLVQIPVNMPSASKTENIKMWRWKGNFGRCSDRSGGGHPEATGVSVIGY